MPPPFGALPYASFVELYRQTAEPLRRYAVRMLGNVAAADDVVQECFARALGAAAFPQDTQEARAYLFRVASNLMRDLWRRRRRELERPAESVEPASPADPAMAIDVARLFETLSLRERQLLWLAHVEGAEHLAIGAALGVGETSVRVLLHRARRKFAHLLRSGGYDPDWRGDDV